MTVEPLASCHALRRRASDDRRGRRGGLDRLRLGTEPERCGTDCERSRQKRVYVSLWPSAQSSAALTSSLPPLCCSAEAELTGPSAPSAASFSPSTLLRSPASPASLHASHQPTAPSTSAVSASTSLCLPPAPLLLHLSCRRGNDQLDRRRGEHGQTRSHSPIPNHSVCQHTPICPYSANSTRSSLTPSAFPLLPLFPLCSSFPYTARPPDIHDRGRGRGEEAQYHGHRDDSPPPVHHRCSLSPRARSPHRAPRGRSSRPSPSRARSPAVEKPDRRRDEQLHYRPSRNDRALVLVPRSRLKREPALPPSVQPSQWEEHQLDGWLEGVRRVSQHRTRSPDRKRVGLHQEVQDSQRELRQGRQLQPPPAPPQRSGVDKERHHMAAAYPIPGPARFQPADHSAGDEQRWRRLQSPSPLLPHPCYPAPHHASRYDPSHQQQPGWVTTYSGPPPHSSERPHRDDAAFDRSAYPADQRQRRDRNDATLHHPGSNADPSRHPHPYPAARPAPPAPPAAAYDRLPFPTPPPLQRPQLTQGRYRTTVEPRPPPQSVASPLQYDPQQSVDSDIYSVPSPSHLRSSRPDRDHRPSHRHPPPVMPPSHSYHRPAHRPRSPPRPPLPPMLPPTPRPAFRTPSPARTPVALRDNPRERRLPTFPAPPVPRRSPPPPAKESRPLGFHSGIPRPSRLAGLLTSEMQTQRPPPPPPCVNISAASGASQRQVSDAVQTLHTHISVLSSPRAPAARSAPPSAAAPADSEAVSPPTSPHRSLTVIQSEAPDERDGAGKNNAMEAEVTPTEEQGPEQSEEEQQPHTRPIAVVPPPPPRPPHPPVVRHPPLAPSLLAKIGQRRVPPSPGERARQAEQQPMVVAAAVSKHPRPNLLASKAAAKETPPRRSRTSRQRKPSEAEKGAGRRTEEEEVKAPTPRSTLLVRRAGPRAPQTVVSGSLDGGQEEPPPPAPATPSAHHTAAAPESAPPMMKEVIREKVRSPNLVFFTGASPPQAAAAPSAAAASNHADISAPTSAFVPDTRYRRSDHSTPRPAPLVSPFSPQPHPYHSSRIAFALPGPPPLAPPAAAPPPPSAPHQRVFFARPSGQSVLPVYVKVLEASGYEVVNSFYDCTLCIAWDGCTMKEIGATWEEAARSGALLLSIRWLEDSLRDGAGYDAVHFCMPWPTH